MKKKILMLLVICAVLVIFSTICAFAAETYGDFTYEVQNGGVTITKYLNGGVTEVVIPDVIHGYPVTAIGDIAFFGCENIVRVEFPTTVTNIGGDAFRECKSLTEIILPDSLTHIGVGAFMECNLKSVTFPDSVTNIGEFAFKFNENLTSIIIPRSVTKIDIWAFNRCDNLQEIYYTGSEDEWNNMEIDYEEDYYGEGNDALKKATIHFNYKPISVKIDGKKVLFDQQPIIEEGRTLVPLRAIFEALDASVDWKNDTQTVISEKDGVRISLQIGSNKLYVDDVEKVLDVPAKLLNGRTLVPVRAISEAFGCNVDWDNDTWTVIITKP